MYGQFDLITLIALVIAVAAIFKLKSVLGQRTDEDDQRIERLKTREREAGARAPVDGGGEVVTLPRRDREGMVPAPAAETATASAETRIRAYPAVDAGVTQGLLAIAKLDPDFDPAVFLAGAVRAYEMILSAFAEGDKRELKDLLSAEVFEGFVAAITERESRKETIDFQFVGTKKSDILEAELKNGVASLTVRFVSELIWATRDTAGEDAIGDAQKIKNVTDVWEFSRDISTARARKNVDWQLAATQAPN